MKRIELQQTPMADKKAQVRSDVPGTQPNGMSAFLPETREPAIRAGLTLTRQFIGAPQGQMRGMIENRRVNGSTPRDFISAMDFDSPTASV